MILILSRDGKSFRVDPEVAGLAEITLNPEVLGRVLLAEVRQAHVPWKRVSSSATHAVWHRPAAVQIMQVLPPTHMVLGFRSRWEDHGEANWSYDQRVYESAWAEFLVRREVDAMSRVTMWVNVELPRRAWFGELNEADGYRNLTNLRMAGVKRYRTASSIRPHGLALRCWAGGNIHPDGVICWGHTLQPLVDKGLASLTSADELFFSSAFNNDLQPTRRRWYGPPRAWGLSPAQQTIPSRMLLGPQMSWAEITEEAPQ